MIDINEYIKFPKHERQLHLKLEEPCVERGGPPKGGLSSYCKGLMAHELDTTIPTGHKILICHACNNERCSSPLHLYWGTSKENCADAIACGSHLTIWERTVEKYGYEESCRRNSRNQLGNKNGSGNANKEKSESHKEKISLNHKGGKLKKII